MKKLLLSLTVGALVAAPVQAQTDVTQFANFTDQATVLYLPFAVMGSGVFDFSTSFGVPGIIDPHIRLYENACSVGGCLGAELGQSNNSGFFDLNVNSFMSRGLNSGEYTLAMSVWDFTEAEARAGNAGFDDVFSTRWFDVEPTTCDDLSGVPCYYRTHIASSQGRAEVLSRSVPEPGTGLLIATGLLGMVGVVRRREDRDADA